MRGILERQMRKCRGLVCCRGQGGAGNRVAGTMHACHAGIGQMRECASAVLGACRPLLDLTCSLYHYPTMQGVPRQGARFPCRPQHRGPDTGPCAACTCLDGHGAHTRISNFDRETRNGVL